jgi:drug/metabolite transporter (DMT)-like permease
VLAFVAVWLVSQTGQGRLQWRDVGLPLASGLGIGLFIVVISRVSGGQVFWPLVAARGASLSVLIGVTIAARRPWPARRNLPIIAAAGVLDAAGNAFVVLAAHAGRLDVAGVLASLYPASTVVLATIILRERISRSQIVGLVAALTATVMITSG